MRKTGKMLLSVFQFIGCVVRGREQIPHLRTAKVLIKVNSAEVLIKDSVLYTAEIK